MKIVIPTYKRVNRQISLQDLETVKEHVWLVCRPEEADKLAKQHHQIKVIDQPVTGIAETLAWICKKGFRDELIWVVDDDLRFAKYFPVPEKKYMHQRDIKREKDLAKDMYENIQAYAGRYNHGGLFAVTYPPEAAFYPAVENRRYFTNKWYNLANIDVEKLDFTSIPYAEDFNVMLQLYEQGHAWTLVYEWGCKPGNTQSPGGCSETRTLETHNESMQALQRRFPNWVKLYDKAVTTGPWSGKNKLGATINIHSKLVSANTFSDLFLVD